MKWTKITIKTTCEAEDIIISAMYDLGLEGAQIEDNVPLTAWEKEQMFVDILPQPQADDHTAYLSFFVNVPDENEEKKEPVVAGLSDGVDNSYVPANSIFDIPLDELLEQMKAELDEIKTFLDIGEGTITVSETEDKDWVNNWKEFFHQFTIDDLLIIPSWEEVKPEDEGKKILHIDPGTAFGTGMHETTQLCIRAMKPYLTGETKMLDVGTGSGILGIVALLYGITSVVGTDLDPCAIEAVEKNLFDNGLSSDKFTLLIGNIINDKQVQDQVGYEAYDIVIANILAEVLVPLTPVIAGQLKKGGIYITSGILCGKQNLVEEACRKAGLTVLTVSQQGEWMSVTARKE